MENLEILWLDDQRNPIKYFKKKPNEKNETLTRNFNFYNNLFKQYDVNFTWVKNYGAFVNEIEKKGMPDLISFDYNLTYGGANAEGKVLTGIDCANWLMQYCKENGIPMPKCYVHSANKRYGPEMNRMLGLNENKNMDKKNTIRLNESDYKVKSALETLNYYYDYAMECFNDPHRGYPKQAVANVIKAAKTLLPYKGQGEDVKNALIKAKQLSNLAKREVEIDRKGQEIIDNEGGLAYMDHLDSAGKIPMVGESVKKVINKKGTMKLTESKLKNIITECVRKALRDIL